MQKIWGKGDCRTRKTVVGDEYSMVGYVSSDVPTCSRRFMRLRRRPTRTVSPRAKAAPRKAGPRQVFLSTNRTCSPNFSLSIFTVYTKMEAAIVLSSQLLSREKRHATVSRKQHGRGNRTSQNPSIPLMMSSKLHFVRRRIKIEAKMQQISITEGIQHE